MASSNNKTVFLKKYTARTKEKVGKILMCDKNFVKRTTKVNTIVV
jgi:hypothetical protein